MSLMYWGKRSWTSLEGLKRKKVEVTWKVVSGVRREQTDMRHGIVGGKLWTEHALVLPFSSKRISYSCFPDHQNVVPVRIT